jgi:hypothetical protein
MFLVACTAKREKGDLSVAELLKRGREFDGKHVAVIGYYVSGVEETCLWSTPEAANHFELLEDRIFHVRSGLSLVGEESVASLIDMRELLAHFIFVLSSVVRC